MGSFLFFSRSVYWLDKLPPERSGLTTKIGLCTNRFLFSSLGKLDLCCLFVTPCIIVILFSTELTPRWSDLCISRKFYNQVTISPIWQVSEWALKAVPSKRVCHLAQPRAPAAGWQPACPLSVPVSTQTAVATSRICQLAQPKRRQVLEKSRHESKHVQVIHLPSKASPHIELLATPKNDHPEFKGDRPVCWSVSKAAKSYITSQRLLDLSSPKERKALYEGYDPYTISRGARSASPSPRIQQLCLPLSRKCSSE
ncbi:sperm microtubule associated protein 2 isoform X2 [Astatotilapia calliptera]|uniref:sperm microtubule associated protein 2 isoform X2 n=1 Tax=Astatotilapia calliptera TaxID=8154 RepID=UPI000E42A339|nr:testicular haploid expressed gene protein isoform X2 [Astatotilapia calliptera]